MSTVIVTTTIESADAAAQISRAVVEARLAACGQVIGPITSTYWWKGKIETAQEWTISFKTTEDVAASLTEHIIKAHPYDLPEVIVTPVIGGNATYLGWVETETCAS